MPETPTVSSAAGNQIASSSGRTSASSFGSTSASSSGDPESLTEIRQWLSAVGAITSAVSSRDSLGEVLTLVAESARSLLGFDFCGVLLPDSARQNLVITGWSGLSSEYVARVNADHPVRLVFESDGSQTGIAAPSSRAFTTSAPVEVSDINAEPQFSPWGGVAREQGYRSMLSVPLVAGGESVGTLNGYHSTVHKFSDQEIARLGLLADQAAIALASARMLVELRDLNESLRAQRDLLTKSQQIHERLLAGVLHGGGLDGLAQTLSTLVARPVLIEDERGEILARTGSEYQLPTFAIRSALERTHDPDARGVGIRRVGNFRIGATDDPATQGDKSVGTEHGTSLSNRTFLVCDVDLAGDSIARIWLGNGDIDLSPLDGRAVEHASIVAALEVVRLRTGAEVEHRLRGELLADILDGVPVASPQMLDRAQRLGHDLGKPHVAMVAKSDHGQERSTAGLQRILTVASAIAARYNPKPLVAMHREYLVLLWPEVSTSNATSGRVPTGNGRFPADNGRFPADKHQSVDAVTKVSTSDAAEMVRHAIGGVPGVDRATIAVSGSGHRSYPQAYRIARGALEIALRSGRSDTTVTLGQLGLAGLLLQLDDPQQLLGYVDHTLITILNHDKQRGTDLVATLRAYLQHRSHRALTAKFLHIHPNTVTQRLQRIQVLAGIDLTDPATVVEIVSALVLLDVASGTPAEDQTALG